jgi:hypothetical protein
MTTMRTSKLLLAGAVIGLLSPTAARAATTTHLIQRGTAVDLSLGVSLATSQPDCTLDVSLSLSAATSVEHVGGGGSTSAGANGFMQISDVCNGRVEFGSFDAPLTSAEFTTGSHSGTLNATIVVTMFVFDPSFNFIGTVDRTLVASGLLFDAVNGDNTVGMTHQHARFPGFNSVSNGHTIEKAANLSGSLTLDGQAVLPNPSAGYSASFETSHEVFVDITK